MNTLTQVRPNIFLINAPAFQAALTRTGGISSCTLRGRIKRALNAQGETKLTFKRGASGKWYVRIAAVPYPMVKPVGSHTKFNYASTLAHGRETVSEFNRAMVLKHGTGANS